LGGQLYGLGRSLWSPRNMNISIQTLGNIAAL
jgi:hypothetical protein